MSSKFRISKLKITLLAALFITPLQGRAESSQTIVTNDTITVAGSETQTVIITRPSDNAVHPALLFIGGMGCYSVNFNSTKIDSYEKIINTAANMGLVTIRVEKTGIGGGVGTPCEQQGFYRELLGYFAAMDSLKKYPFIDAKNILVFGHSIGGVIAPYIAAKYPVKSVAVIGSLGEKWYDYELTNTKRQSVLAGETPQQVASYMTYQTLIFQELLLKKRTPADILQQYPDAGPYMESPVHYSYLQELTDLDVAAALKNSSSKYTVFYGSSDYIGSQESALVPFVKTVNANRPVPVQLKKLQDIDHFFMDAKTQQESFNTKHGDGSPLQLQKSFYVELSKWISESIR